VDKQVMAAVERSVGVRRGRNELNLVERHLHLRELLARRITPLQDSERLIVLANQVSAYFGRCH
jgi:hypothetical protein